MRILSFWGFFLCGRYADFSARRFMPSMDLRIIRISKNSVSRLNGTAEENNLYFTRTRVIRRALPSPAGWISQTQVVSPFLSHHNIHLFFLKYLTDIPCLPSGLMGIRSPIWMF